MLLIFLIFRFPSPFFPLSDRGITHFYPKHPSGLPLVPLIPPPPPFCLRLHMFVVVFGGVFFEIRPALTLGLLVSRRIARTERPGLGRLESPLSAQTSSPPSAFQFFLGRVLFSPLFLPSNPPGVSSQFFLRPRHRQGYQTAESAIRHFRPLAFFFGSCVVRSGGGWVGVGSASGAFQCRTPL